MKKVGLILIFGIMFLVGGFGVVSGSGLLWSLESDGSWDAETVSMGDYGSQVFTDFGIPQNHYQLFSSYDRLNSPVPIFDYGVNELNYIRKVDSSKNSDVHAGIYGNYTDDTYTLLNLVVKKFHSSSTVPDWEYILPGFYGATTKRHLWGIFVSDDGELVIAWRYVASGMKINYFVFDSSDGSLLKEDYIDSFGETSYYDFSEDGSTAIFRSQLKIVIADIMSGSVIYSQFLPGFLSSPVSLNYDGSRAVYSKDNIIVLERQGAVYNLLTTINEPLDNSLYVRSVSLSEEGDRLVYALLDVTNTEGSIKAIDLENDNQETMRYDYDIPGIWINPVNHISMSDDGQTFAAGFMGDEMNSIPELLVFHVNSNVPIEEFDLSWSGNEVCSVLDMEISPDGTKVAVAHKGAHAMDWGGGGAIKLYEIGEPDLTLTGVPRAGSTVRFEQPYLGGNQINRVLYSKTFRPSMTPFGWLYPDRHSLFILPRGIDTGALTRTIFTIPDEVGEEYWFQGWSLGPRGLSENYVKMRVLPAG